MRRNRVLKKDLDDSDHSDREAERKGEKKREDETLLPIEPHEICHELKRIVGLDDQSGEEADAFLNNPKWKQAFQRVKVADPITGKRRGGKGNVFHHIVLGTGQWETEELRRVLTWLLDSGGTATRHDKESTRVARPFQHLPEEELGSQTPMHMALDVHNRNDTFVKVMLDSGKPVPGNLAIALCRPLRRKISGEEEPSTGNTCLHLAISQGSKDKARLFMKMETYFDVLKEQHWHPLQIREPDQGNTPPHLAVIHSRTGGAQTLARRVIGLPEENRMEGTVQFVKFLIESFPKALEIRNNALRTPFQERICHLETASYVREGILMAREVRRRAENPPPRSLEELGGNGGDAESTAPTKDENFVRGLIGLVRASRGPEPNRKEPPPNKSAASDRSSEEALDQEARMVVKSYKQSLGDMSQLGDADLVESDEFRRVVIGDPIVEYLRYYCIRNMNRDEVLDCLYQPGQGASPATGCPR